MTAQTHHETADETEQTHTHTVTPTTTDDHRNVDEIRNVEEQKRSLESGFGAWDWGGKALYCGHAFWLLKELFWVLIIPYAAFLCSAVAIICISFSFFKRVNGGVSGHVYNEIRTEIMIGFVHITWLIGNSVDMIGALIYDSGPDEEDKPPYTKNMVQLCYSETKGDVIKSERDYESCMDTAEDYRLAARIVYLLAISSWAIAASYLLCVSCISSSRLVAQTNEFQTILLDGGWLVFWVLKDFCWTFDKNGFVAAIVCWSVHFILLIIAFLVASSGTYVWDGIQSEELNRMKNALLTLDWPMVSYVCWSIGALFWILQELAFDESLTWRYIAAVAFSISFLLFLRGYAQAQAKGNSLLLLHHKNP